jgi:hypothetical protein
MEHSHPVFKDSIEQIEAMRQAIGTISPIQSVLDPANIPIHIVGGSSQTGSDYEDKTENEAKRHKRAEIASPLKDVTTLSTLAELNHTVTKPFYFIGTTTLISIL